MIPKIIHQIWVGPNKMPEREAGFVEEVKAMHPDYHHMFWTDEFDTGMPEAMQKQYEARYNEGKWAWCADILRIWVVSLYGGFYLDVDFKPLQRLDSLLKYDAVLCYHPHDHTDLTIVNGAFGAAQYHPMLKYCADSIGSSSWWVGPQWMGETVRKYWKIPMDYPQNLFLQKLQEHNISYMSWKTFEEQFAKHFSLYSWSDRYVVT
jgi:mannosyltransferase OCH1-like enzyme